MVLIKCQGKKHITFFLNYAYKYFLSFYKIKISLRCFIEHTFKYLFTQIKKSCLTTKKKIVLSYLTK